MSNFEDKITLQYEKELVKNGIDFDNPKDVQYLYNWAKNKEKECDSLKEDIEGLVEALENLNSVVDHYWNNGRTDAQVNAITSVQQKCQKILIKHKQS